MANLKKGIASFLTVIVVVFGISCQQAAAQVELDNAFALGVVLTGRSEKESTKRAIYKLTKLEAAQQLFSTDKQSAMKLIGFDPAKMPAEYIAAGLKYTEQNFINEYSTKIDNEMLGITFGDLELSKVAKIALAGVTTYYGAGSGVLLRTAVAGGSTFGSDYLNGIVLQDPVTIDEPGDEVIFGIAKRSLEYTKTDPILATEMTGTLAKYADITNIDKIKDTPEYHVFLDENELGVLQNRIENSDESTRNLDKKIADRLYKLSTLEKENLALQEIRRSEQIDEAKAKSTEAALRDNQNNIRSLQVGFGGLDVFAHLVGAPKHQLQAIQASERAAEALYAISKAAGNPMSYMGGYFTLAAVAISMFQSSDDKQEGIQNILSAIKQLSEQIDELRIEMATSFSAIDAELARGFVQQTSLLEAIKLYEQGQTQELVRLAATVQQTRDELRAAMDAYAKRQQEALWAECLSVPMDAADAADDQLLRRCLINAQLMAVRWSSDEVSVATSMNDLESGLSKTSGTALALARVTPLYAKMKFGDGSTVANPQAWLWGANLTALLLTKYPASFNASSEGSIEQILVKGREIQGFYQTLFSSGLDANKFGLDTSFIVYNLLQYSSAAAEYLEMLFNQIQKVISPWESSDQVLPEEHVTAEDTNGERAYLQGTGRREVDARRNAEIVNVSQDRRALPGRGSFNQDVAKGFYTAATGMLRACSDLKTVLSMPSAADAEVGGLSFNPDLILLRGNGLKLDSSVLSLIPRPALWLERLNPQRYSVEACVENYSGASAGRTRRGPNPNIFFFNVSLTIDIQFVVIDHQRPAQSQSMKVGSARLTLRSKLPFNQENWKAGVYPILDSTVSRHTGICWSRRIRYVCWAGIW